MQMSWDRLTDEFEERALDLIENVAGSIDTIDQQLADECLGSLARLRDFAMGKAMLPKKTVSVIYEVFNGIDHLREWQPDNEPLAIFVDTLNDLIQAVIDPNPSD